jgi:hypothetical protein
MKLRLLMAVIIGGAFYAAYLLLFPEARVDKEELARITAIDALVDINDGGLRDCKIDSHKVTREIEKGFENRSIRRGGKGIVEYSVVIRGMKLAFIPYCVITIESQVLSYPPFTPRETKLEGRHLWLSRRMRIIHPDDAKETVAEMAGEHANNVAAYMGLRRR